ncbi:RimJ/RimL family protein N-acetyltransferase [Sphingomonas insulae]|uniref:GNAT family N-acetyltransferase n=1 Tax=Sphingomonas insulae TaxID=424800 RepID=A0ABN1HM17_9SPHN|nr:GNAT family N-acetyltransferase [Sphingomonas insulae]NIJ30179.1 RimJ/RimL family protein N-acetyltransferase [Sphingomonas insulae]
MIAPALRTERLVLRGHAPDDLAVLAAMWQAPAVYQMIGGAPRPDEEVWIRLLRSIGQWQAFGYGSWVVADDTGVVGEIGLIEARRAIDPPLAVPEVGWTLAPAAHGRGYAHEALCAALAWADGQGIVHTTCIIDPGNTPSLKLAAKVGYVPVRDATYKDHPIHVLERRP